MELKDRIVEFCAKNPGATWMTLKDGFPEHFDAKDAEGQPLALELTGFNIVLWQGVTEEFWACLNGLIKEGAIKMSPCGSVLYIMDGGYIRLPTARGIKPYKSKRWLPVVFTRGDSSVGPAGRI